MAFNSKNHADELLEVCSLIGYAQAAAEGLQLVNSEISASQYNNCAAGVFGLIDYALKDARCILENAETVFRNSHGLKYGGGDSNR